MSRLSYVLVALIVVVVSTTIIGWAFFGNNPLKSLKQVAESGQEIEGLPVDPADEKVVKSVDVVYVFAATLRSVNRKNPQKHWLSTNLNGKPGIPRFYLTGDTVFVFDENGLEKRATSKDLAAKQRLWITSAYDTDKKTWETTKVVIKSSPSTATPSASN